MESEKAKKEEYQRKCEQGMKEKWVCSECNQDAGYSLYFDGWDRLYSECGHCGWKDHIGYTG